MKNKNKEKKVKGKKDVNKTILITLFVLVILEVVTIPLLIYAKITKVLPVIFFLVIPTLLAIAILLLSRNSLIDYKIRKEKLTKKEG